MKYQSGTLLFPLILLRTLVAPRASFLMYFLSNLFSFWLGYSLFIANRLLDFLDWNNAGEDTWESVKFSGGSRGPFKGSVEILKKRWGLEIQRKWLYNVLYVEYHLNMQLLLDLSVLPLTSCFSSGRTISDLFPAADTMGKTVSREPWLTSEQAEGNVRTVANHSGYFSCIADCNLSWVQQ